MLKKKSVVYKKEYICRSRKRDLADQPIALVDKAIITKKTLVSPQVFSPMEEISDILELRNIAKQIIQDAYSDHKDSRMTAKEALKIKTFIRNNRIDINRIYDIKLPLLKLIIEEAKTLPLYFNRFFPVSCENAKGKNHLLAISHTGLKLVDRQRDDFGNEKLSILESHGFDNVIEPQILTLNTIKIHLVNHKPMVLHTQWVYEINDILMAFQKEIYVMKLSSKVAGATATETFKGGNNNNKKPEILSNGKKHVDNNYNSKNLEGKKTSIRNNDTRRTSKLSNGHVTLNSDDSDNNHCNNSTHLQQRKGSGGHKKSQTVKSDHEGSYEANFKNRLATKFNFLRKRRDSIVSDSLAPNDSSSFLNSDPYYFTHKTRTNSLKSLINLNQRVGSTTDINHHHKGHDKANGKAFLRNKWYQGMLHNHTHMRKYEDNEKYGNNNHTNDHKNLSIFHVPSSLESSLFNENNNYKSNHIDTDRCLNNPDQQGNISRFRRFNTNPHAYEHGEAWEPIGKPNPLATRAKLKTTSGTDTEEKRRRHYSDQLLILQQRELLNTTTETSNLAQLQQQNRQLSKSTTKLLTSDTNKYLNDATNYSTKFQGNHGNDDVKPQYGDGPYSSILNNNNNNVRSKILNHNDGGNRFLIDDNFHNGHGHHCISRHGDKTGRLQDIMGRREENLFNDCSRLCHECGQHRPNKEFRDGPLLEHYGGHHRLPNAYASASTPATASNNTTEHYTYRRGPFTEDPLFKKNAISHDAANHYRSFTGPTTNDKGGKVERENDDVYGTSWKNITSIKHPNHAVAVTSMIGRNKIESYQQLHSPSSTTLPTGFSTSQHLPIYRMDRISATAVSSQDEHSASSPNTLPTCTTTDLSFSSLLESGGGGGGDNGVDGPIYKVRHTTPGYLNTTTNSKSFVYFALLHFRTCIDKIKSKSDLESLRIKCLQGNADKNQITYLMSLKDEYFRYFEKKNFYKAISYTKKPLDKPLLKLPSNEENKLSLECFLAILRYMNDYPMPTTDTGEVDCIYTLLTACHRFKQIQDEVFAQIIKQLINNKSEAKDSHIKGWKALVIVTSYFCGTGNFKTYLTNFLESVSLDASESFNDISKECLLNYETTLKYGGRKNVPSSDEILALSYGKSFKRQFYRIPGGGGRLFQLKCSSVVEKVIKDICWDLLETKDKDEIQEFALYIVYPSKKVEYLNKDEYVLDVTTELDKKFLHDNMKNGYFVFFKRHMWSHPLTFDNGRGQCYIEFHYKQILADYLAGLIFMIPKTQTMSSIVDDHKLKIPQYIEDDLAELACLIHRASGAETYPAHDDIVFLFPETLIENKAFDKLYWYNIILTIRKEFNRLSPSEARIKFMESLKRSSQLFGSTYFNVKSSYDNVTLEERILAISKEGVYFLPPNASEILSFHPYRRIETINKTMTPDESYIELKVKTCTVLRSLKISTDQCHEAFYLINTYMRQELEETHFLN